jgi:hypothetical protein
MTKLKSADHVQVITNVLSQDSWLADYVWDNFYRDLEDGKYVPAPDRVTQRSGGLVVIEQGPTVWQGTGRPIYPTRADWYKEEKRFRGPFPKSNFRRSSKKKIDGYDVREFTTPHVSLDALTYEKGGVIEKIEFVNYHNKVIVRTENLF